MAAWRLQLHGTAQLVPAGPGEAGALPLIERDAAWLALVALGDRLTTERIAAMVWPRPTRAASLQNLRTRLKRLRERADARLVSLGLVPRLEADLIVDASPADGPLLAGLDAADMPEFADWLAAERSRREAQQREVWAAAAEQAEADGQLATALRWAARLRDAEPASEHAARRLMRLHHRRGDRAAAVHAFEQLAARLDEEFGLEPDAETLRLYDQVLAARPAAIVKPTRAPMPASLHRPPRTIGRDAELRRALTALGTGKAVVIEGEAGIGKTRLLEELAAAGRRPLRVAATAADTQWPGRVAGRLVEALIDVAPELQTSPALAALRPQWRLEEASSGAGAATSIESLGGALGDLVRTVQALGAGPLLLDDLHHVDATSAELVQRLLDAPATRAVGWVIALRPHPEVPRLGALRESSQVEWITVGPLPPGAVPSLLESLALPGLDVQGMAAPLARRVGRNPQHLLVTMMGWWHGDDLDEAGVPRARSLAERLRQRLAQLTPAARELARVAAVAVPNFSIEMAAAVTRHSPLALADPWHELESAGILAAESFAHDLMQEAVLADLPQPVARHLHGCVARWLVAHGHALPETVARHWQAAGEALQAATAWRAVADRASWLGRKGESADLLLRAAGCFEAAGQLQLAAAAAADAVDGRMFGGSPAAAMQLAEEWLVRVPAHRAFILGTQAQAALACGAVDQAITMARSALAQLPPEEELRRLHASQVLASALGERGEAEEALALLAPWRARVDTLADASQRMMFWSAVAMTASGLCRLSDAEQAAKAQLALATEHDARDSRITALQNLFGVHARRGDGRAALAMCEAAEQLMAIDGEPELMRVWNQAHFGLAHAALGHLGPALDALEAALRDDRLPVPLRGVAQNTIAQMLIRLGQPAKAGAWIADPLAGAAPVRRAARLLVQALVTRAMSADPMPLLTQALALSDGARALVVRLAIEAERLPYAADPHAALKQATALVDEAEKAELHAAALLLDRRRLDLLRRTGACAGAVELARAVRPRASRVHGVQLWVPETLEACALAFDAAGHDEESVACRTDAWRWLHDEALPRVPDAYRHSFMERDPLHLKLRRRFA